MKLQRDLCEFIELLNSHAVDYVVVGGHAVAFHGHPRYTGDIDFLIRATEENAQRVLSVLAAFGFADLELDVASLTIPERVIQLGCPPNRIDLLTSISGVAFREAWETSEASELGGLPVRMLSRDALLKNKRASGRPKDLADIAELDRL